MEEEFEDLYADSSDDELNPRIQTPALKRTILRWRRVYNFPSPENFRHFVESPSSPTHSEGKASPKYVCCNSFRTFSVSFPFFLSSYCRVKGFLELSLLVRDFLWLLRRGYI